MRYSRYFIVIFIAILACGQQRAWGQQQVRGKVTARENGQTVPIIAANVYWLNTAIGTVTDTAGEFHLTFPAIPPRTLVVSHAGYEGDTLNVTGTEFLSIALSARRSQKTVEIVGERDASYLSAAPIKTEVLTRKELLKAPCCDLAGCFSTNSAVQPEVTDVIADTRDLAMLGLSGVYVQTLLDNVPTLMTGLNQSYGVSFIPGALIDKIWIVKGLNSVIQGYESVSGQVNVLLKETEQPYPLYLNVYTNASMEKQANLNAGAAMGNWQTLFAAQTVQPSNRVDEDGDSFLDQPLITRYSLFNKWKYANEDDGLLSVVGIKYTDERRIGGQRQFNDNSDPARSSLYGQIISNRRFEAYDKSEFLIPDAGKITVHGALSRHTQDAAYGKTTYTGRQWTAFADAYYTHPVTEEISLTSGLSFKSLSLTENILLNENPFGKTYGGDHETRENVPGVFFEGTANLFDDAVTVLAGGRYDRHSAYGDIFTKRMLVKYSPDDLTTLRASAGTGFHAPLVFAEHSGLFASWRNISTPSALEPERAVNYGLSATRVFEFAGVGATLSMDAFRTAFTKQVIVDYDRDPDAFVIRNLDGSSYSDNMLAELRVVWFDGFETKCAYTWSDVFSMENDIRKTLPFVSKHKFLGTLSWELPGTGWSFNTSLEWRGSQLLPDTRALPEQYRVPGESDPFTIVNLQVTKSWPLFDVYAGAENLTDFRQPNPIINAGHPFERYFEPNYTWGPLKGREVYLGLRARLFRYAEEE